jgi:hypothetical protein
MMLFPSPSRHCFACGKSSLFANGIAVAVALSILGCRPAAKGAARHAVSGRITFGGDPVPVGTIAFEPDASAGNNGPAGYGDIKDGKYVTQGRFGAVGGPHIVRIEGFDPPDPANIDAAPRPLFREYTTKIDLPRARSTQDFDVPKKPSPAKK